MASHGLKVRILMELILWWIDLTSMQSAHSLEETLCRCTRCLQANSQGIHQPVWRKEAHDWADIACASVFATCGRGVPDRGTPLMWVSAATSWPHSRVLFSMGRAPCSSSRPISPLIPHPNLDHTIWDETCWSPSSEADFTFELMQVNKLDEEEQHVVLQMGSPTLDLNLKGHSFEPLKLCCE